jgi:hypothetical protein
VEFGVPTALLTELASSALVWRASPFVDLKRRRNARLEPGTTKNGGGRLRVPHPRRQSLAGGAAVPGRIPHDFRSVAMKITGHKTEAIYRRYAIVSDADLQEAAPELAGTFTGTIRALEVAPTS